MLWATVLILDVVVAVGAGECIGTSGACDQFEGADVEKVSMLQSRSGGATNALANGKTANLKEHADIDRELDEASTDDPRKTFDPEEWKEVADALQKEEDAITKKLNDIREKQDKKPDYQKNFNAKINAVRGSVEEVTQEIFTCATSPNPPVQQCVKNMAFGALDIITTVMITGAIFPPAGPIIAVLGGILKIFLGGMGGKIKPPLTIDDIGQEVKRQLRDESLRKDMAKLRKDVDELKIIGDIHEPVVMSWLNGSMPDAEFQKHADIFVGEGWDTFWNPFHNIFDDLGEVWNSIEDERGDLIKLTPFNKNCSTEKCPINGFHHSNKQGSPPTSQGGHTNWAAVWDTTCKEHFDGLNKDQRFKKIIDLMGLYNVAGSDMAMVVSVVRHYFDQTSRKDLAESRERTLDFYLAALMRNMNTLQGIPVNDTKFFQGSLLKSQVTQCWNFDPDQSKSCVHTTGFDRIQQCRIDEFFIAGANIWGDCRNSGQECEDTETAEGLKVHGFVTVGNVDNSEECVQRLRNHTFTQYHIIGAPGNPLQGNYTERDYSNFTQDMADNQFARWELYPFVESIRTSAMVDPLYRHDQGKEIMPWMCGKGCITNSKLICARRDVCATDTCRELFSPERWEYLHDMNKGQ